VLDALHRNQLFPTWLASTTSGWKVYLYLPTHMPFAHKPTVGAALGRPTRTIHTSSIDRPHGTFFRRSRTEKCDEKHTLPQLLTS